MFLIPSTNFLKFSKSSRFLSVQRFMCTVKNPSIKKSKSTIDRIQNFVDFKRITLIAGNGGNGHLSFTSLPFKEFAGPDGGNGGNGAHIILIADKNTRCLANLQSIYKANDGVKGSKFCCHGKNAEHLVLQVPVGTTVKDEHGNIFDCLENNGEKFLAVRGGAGGKGNHYFVSNKNQVPYQYELGGKGETKIYNIELRKMAHVGLIGFPNVGKSTLLRAISRAKPKVAAYPFTTLKPHIGIIEYPDFVQIAVADIPGLIEGAHMNYGLGFSFLKHIERCTCLLYVIDGSLADPIYQLNTLQYELEQYQEGLSQRPHAIIVNKIDLIDSFEFIDILKQHTQLPIFNISAVHRKNIKPLLIHIRELYDSNKNERSLFQNNIT